jgi:hypothetical protein
LEREVAEAKRRYRIAAVETAILRAWTEEETAKGRSPLELTWGNCLRDLDLLVDAPDGRQWVSMSALPERYRKLVASIGLELDEPRGSA